MVMKKLQRSLSRATIYSITDSFYLFFYAAAVMLGGYYVYQGIVDVQQQFLAEVSLSQPIERRETLQQSIMSVVFYVAVMESLDEMITARAALVRLFALVDPTKTSEEEINSGRKPVTSETHRKLITR